MHVTKDILDESLRSSYALAKLAAFMLRRESAVRLIFRLGKTLHGKNIKGLRCEQRFITDRNIRVRIYRPLEDKGELPVMLYLHGGGYMIGSPEEYASVIRDFIQASPCIVVAPDYRKSLEAPYPAAFDDCYDSLLWVRDNARALGASADQIVVGGHSAGGGLTAAVTQKATDTGDVKIAFQMPFYPMIDDREDSGNDAPVWDSRTNKLGWSLYLRGVKDITAYAAAARATDLSRLPPTLTFVGDLEPFKDSTVAYVERLKAAGVPVRFELFKGAFHGFDFVSGNAAISQRAKQFALSNYKELMTTCRR